MAFTKYFSRILVHLLSLIVQVAFFKHSIYVVFLEYFRHNCFIVMQVEPLLFPLLCIFKACLCKLCFSDIVYKWSLLNTSAIFVSLLCR